MYDMVDKADKCSQMNELFNVLLTNSRTHIGNRRKPDVACAEQASGRAREACSQAKTDATISRLKMNK